MDRITTILVSTEMHFVFCVRPNSKAIESSIENEYFTQQIKQLQLVEITQFRSNSFPINMTPQNFVKWYGTRQPLWQVTLHSHFASKTD